MSERVDRGAPRGDDAPRGGRPDPANAPGDNVPTDPSGPDPEDIPDPMPAALRATEQADRAFEDADPMGGEAPSG